MIGHSLCGYGYNLIGEVVEELQEVHGAFAQRALTVAHPQGHGSQLTERETGGEFWKSYKCQYVTIERESLKG